MKECIKMGRKMDLGSSHGAMGRSIQETLITMSSTAEAFICGRMVERTEGIGVRARCMGRGGSSFQTDAFMRENTRTT
jgi:hypothetical protein